MQTPSRNPSGPLYSPSGRIGRASYWLRLSGLLGLLAVTVWWAGDERNVLAGAVFLGALLLVPLQVAKRLHDVGWSGWWALLVFIPPLTPIVLMVMGCLGSSSSVDANEPMLQA